MAAGQNPQALLTTLYRSTDRLCRCGASIATTTVAAILTLPPLALAIGEGSAMQQPLATAIIAGLLAQMPLVRLVMPSLYALVGGVPKDVGPKRA